MKYLKRFENIKNQPEVGDYVKIEPYMGFMDFIDKRYDETLYFLRNNIGQVRSY